MNFIVSFKSQYFKASHEEENRQVTWKLVSPKVEKVNPDAVGVKARWVRSDGGEYGTEEEGGRVGNPQLAHTLGQIYLNNYFILINFFAYLIH